MDRLTDLDREHNYYRLLGVDPSAPEAIIRNAYRVMMLELGGHPDTGGSHEHAVLLNRAREILLDRAMRYEYDRHWSEVEWERRIPSWAAVAEGAREPEQSGGGGGAPAGGFGAEERGRLYQVAKEIELRSGFVSATILQRRLGISIELAAELISHLDAQREATAQTMAGGTEPRVVSEVGASPAARLDTSAIRRETPSRPTQSMDGGTTAHAGGRGLRQGLLALLLALPLALAMVAALRAIDPGALRSGGTRIESSVAPPARARVTSPSPANSQTQHTPRRPPVASSKPAPAAPGHPRRPWTALKPQAAAPQVYPVPGLYRVTLEAILRAAPDETSEPVTRLRPGLRVSAVADAGRFLRIESASGKPPGYVLKGALAFAPEEPPAAGAVEPSLEQLLSQPPAGEGPDARSTEP